MRPARKAREGRIPGVCNRRATPRRRMSAGQCNRIGDATLAGAYSLMSSWLCSWSKRDDTTEIGYPSENKEAAEIASSKPVDPRVSDPSGEVRSPSLGA